MVIVTTNGGKYNFSVCCCIRKLQGCQRIAIVDTNKAVAGNTHQFIGCSATTVTRIKNMCCIITWYLITQLAKIYTKTIKIVQVNREIIMKIVVQHQFVVGVFICKLQSSFWRSCSYTNKIVFGDG